MWGLASQAGAGVAIAGLTATYYALVRRNHQMEREAIHRESAIAITGQGDGQYDFDYKRKDSQLNSSQMLLKKELQELSMLNGSTSGLNIIYHPAPYHRFQKSDFEVHPIISRVNTRPSTNFSDEDFEFDSGGDPNTSVSLFGSEPVIETMKTTASASTSSQTDEEFVNSENSLGESIKTGSTSEDGSMQTMEISTEEEESSLETLLQEESSKVNKVVEKWRYVQDNMQLQRSNSPICFYKNPGFGNRYPFRMKEQTAKPHMEEPLSSLSTLTSSTSSATKEEKFHEKNDSENDKETLSPSSTSESNKNYKDSTLFLLSPVLSESNVSVCEKGIQEKLSDQSKSSASEETDSEAGVKSTLETVSEYNESILKQNAVVNAHKGRGEGDTMPLIKLKQGPEDCNLCPKTLPIPIHEDFPPSTDTPPGDEKEQDAPKEVKEEETPNENSSECVEPPLQNEKESLSKPEEIQTLDELVDTKALEEEETKWLDDETTPLEEVTKSDPIISLLEEIVNVEPSLKIHSPPPESMNTTSGPRSGLVTNIPHDSWISLPVRVYFNSLSTMPWLTIGLCIVVVVIAGLLGIIMQRLAHEIVHPRNPR